MTAVIHELMSVLTDRDINKSQLALITLTYIPPLSKKLIESVISTRIPSIRFQCQGKLLISITKRFQTFDGGTMSKIQSWWKTKPYCIRTLTGLYYANAAYNGFVKEHIEHEMLSQSELFSDVTLWQDFIFTDTDLFSTFLSLPNEIECVCQRLSYLHHLLSTTTQRTQDTNIFQFLLLLSVDHRFTDCVRQHLTDIKFALGKIGPFLPITYELVPQMCATSFAHLELAEDILDILLHNCTFVLSFDVFCTVVEKSRITRLAPEICKHFFNTCIRLGRCCSELDDPNIKFLLNVILRYTSLSQYEVIINWISADVINSNVWVDYLMSLNESEQSGQNYKLLMLYCLPKLTTSNQDVFSKVLCRNVSYGITNIDLICELHSVPNDLANTSIGKEALASSGDWNMLVECSDNLSLAGRVIQRLHRRNLKIPDSVLQSLTEKHINLLWTCAVTSCVKHLCFIKSLNLHHPVVSYTIKSHSKSIESLPQSIQVFLPYTKFVHFCRVWTSIILVLPRRRHRQNLKNILSLLARYETKGVKSPSQIISHDVCEKLSLSLQNTDINVLREQVKRGCNNNQYLGLIIHVLYSSRLNRKRFLQLLGVVGSKTVSGLVVKYRTKVMIENPFLFSEEYLWSDLRQTTSHKAWLYLFEEASQCVVDNMCRRLAADARRAQVVNIHITEIISKCSTGALIDIVITLLGHLRGCLSNICLFCILSNTLSILESVSPESFRKLPTIVLDDFYRLGEKFVHIRGRILSKLIAIRLYQEQKQFNIVNLKIPTELTQHVKAFFMFQI